MIILEALKTAGIVGGVTAFITLAIMLPCVFFDDLVDSLMEGGRRAILPMSSVVLYIGLVMFILVFGVYMLTGGK